mmetsp:Transcript_17359/g.20436  ORF Transcript_17359/g.20436 Transcript_17359/m.20436 type:complete len:298 (+) Transcript_17359:75-968(+)
MRIKGSDSKARVQSFSDTESLIATCAILTALLLSFLVNMSTNYDYNSLDRGNFREAYYDWPNKDFIDFIVWQLEKDDFNFTVEITHNKVMDVKEVLYKRYNDVCKGDDDHSCNAVGNLPYWDCEYALEIIFPIFPLNKLRGFFDYESDTFTQVVNRAKNFYAMVPIAINMLVVVLVGSVVLSISLAMSDCREDISGIQLKKFNKYAIPVILFLYFMLLAAMVLCLIAVGSISTTMDAYVYRMDAFYAYFAFYFTIPGGVILLIAAVFIGRYATMSDSEIEENEKSKNEKQESSIEME